MINHLHALHASLLASPGRRGQAVRAAIERSLGSPAGFGLSGTRQDFLEAMREAGVLVPAGAALTSRDDLDAWAARHSPPFVIKAEGSWGGSGVEVVATVAEAKDAYSHLSAPLAVHKALRFRLMDRDPFAMARFIQRRKRRVMVQAHVTGRQVTCMVASWRGQRVASVNAEVLSTQGRAGASTMLRLIDNQTMDDAAATTAARLGLSGFFGLDFIIEDKSGACFLIEMNPRATQLGHIRLRGADLVGRLLEAAGGRAAGGQTLPDHGPVIAFFPQALRFLDKDVMLHDVPIDIPWGEPALVRELLRLPWTRRGALARLESSFRRNDAFGSAIEPRRVEEILAELRRRAAAAEGLAQTGPLFRAGGSG